MCKILIDGQMPSLKNSGKIGRNGYYTDPKVKKFMDEAKDQVREQWKKEILKKVDNLTFVFYNRDKRKHDLSNELDTAIDILKKIVIEDDNQFCVDSIQIQYGGVSKENPRTEIWIDY